MTDLSKPILPGTAATDYERYLRTDELLALQKTADEAVHHDEHLFQAVHQASELWLKLACTEIEVATGRTAAGDAAAAARLVRRASACLELVLAQLRMFEHMNPVDYAVVRTALGHGAGFDSPGFKRVHRVSPPLGEAFASLLQRHGLDLYALYRASGAHEDLYQLAEAMITWDERNIMWRYQHLKSVERIIGGHVIGTQGTPVESLSRRIDVRFFPALWEVRDEITTRSPLGADGHGNS